MYISKYPNSKIFAQEIGSNNKSVINIVRLSVLASNLLSDLDLQEVYYRYVANSSSSLVARRS